MDLIKNVLGRARGDARPDEPESPVVAPAPRPVAAPAAPSRTPTLREFLAGRLAAAERRFEDQGDRAAFVELRLCAHLLRTRPDELADVIASRWPTESDETSRFVVCTGGEPLLQVDEHLIASLHERGFQVAIETNGTRLPPRGIAA